MSELSALWSVYAIGFQGPLPIPVMNMLQPMTGIKKLLSLEMNLKFRSRWNSV